MQCGNAGRHPAFVKEREVVARMEAMEERGMLWVFVAVEVLERF